MQVGRWLAYQASSTDIGYGCWIFPLSDADERIEVLSNEHDATDLEVRLAYAFVALVREGAAK